MSQADEKRMGDPGQRGNYDDPELIAMDILGTEGPQVGMGYDGRSVVGQRDAVTLAKAYLELRTVGGDPE